jgi:hypothetical protein
MAITIGLLMCVPGIGGVVLGFILREHEGANIPLWSPYRAINLPIWLGLLFLAGGIGYTVWGAVRLRNVR